MCKSPYPLTSRKCAVVPFTPLLWHLRQTHPLVTPTHPLLKGTAATIPTGTHLLPNSNKTEERCKDRLSGKRNPFENEERCKARLSGKRNSSPNAGWQPLHSSSGRSPQQAGEAPWQYPAGLMLSVPAQLLSLQVFSHSSCQTQIQLIVLDSKFHELHTRCILKALFLINLEKLNYFGFTAQSKKMIRQ